MTASSALKRNTLKLIMIVVRSPQRTLTQIRIQFNNNDSIQIFGMSDSFQVESEEIDKSKIKVEETTASDEEKQKLQQQSENAPQVLTPNETAAGERNSTTRAVDYVNACGADGSDGSGESPTVTSALPTTVITTQRHRMITTAGHIR